MRFDVWTWNVSVWEYVRSELKKVNDGLRVMPVSDEALLSEIDTNVVFDDVAHGIAEVEV